MPCSHPKGFGRLSVFVLVLVLAALGWILTPYLNSKAQNLSDRSVALANAKEVVGGLLIFKEDRGSYPCDRTRARLEKEGIRFLPKGTSSNAYLAQLVATKTLNSEEYFHTPGLADFRKGDELKKSPDTLLAPGENGFAYIMGTGGKPLIDTNFFTPLILAPIKTKSVEPIFETEPYLKKFVYGCADGSSSVGDLDESGRAISTDQKSFFQSGIDSLFGTDIPVIKYPLRP